MGTEDEGEWQGWCVTEGDWNAQGLGESPEVGGLERNLELEASEKSEIHL